MRRTTFFKSIKYSMKLTLNANKLLIFLYFFLNIVCKTLPLVNPFILKNILDAISNNTHNQGKTLLWITYYIVVLLVYQIASKSFSITSDLITEKTTNKYLINYLDKMKKLPLSVVDTSTGKDMVEDARYCGWDVSNFFHRMISVLSYSYTFVITLYAILHFDILFTLIFILLSIPGILLDNIYDRKTEALRRSTAPDVRKFSYYRWMLTDKTTAKDIRMYDLTDSLKGRYNEEKNKYRSVNKLLDKWRLTSTLATTLISYSGEIVFTLVVIIKAILGEITVGDVALYIGLAGSTLDSFKNVAETFAWLITRYTDNMLPIFMFYEYPCLCDKDSCRCLEEFESIRFDDVYFRYPNTDRFILEGVSFSLHKGEKMSIVGMNGAGKSTIIKLMLGLYPIDSGKILINEYPIEEYNINDVRKMFSVLFQDYVKYPLTLRENVALSDFCNGSNNEKIIEALKKSGVYDEIEFKLSNGLDTYLTREFSDTGLELSGGQWQKIALARAYFKNAPIVVFDEPSAALDADAEERILINFKNISSGKTGIIISHRISSSRIVDKIIVLDSGKIIEKGTHDELILYNGFYSKLYNLQRDKYTINEEN